MEKHWHRLGVFLGGFIVIGILLPSKSRVDRDIDINAYAATIFSLVNDFRQVNRWSGWMDEDPNARFEISGPARGEGATMKWQGQIIGTSQQTIIASEQYTRIVRSEGPDGDDSDATQIVFAETDGRTKVTWTYQRDYGFNLPGRYFGFIRRRIVAPRVESDLARLRDFAESLPKTDFSSMDVEQIVVGAVDFAYVTTTSLPSARAISEAMGGAYFEVLRFIDEQNLEEAGAPLSITRTFSGSELVFDAGIPIRGATDDVTRAESGVRIGATYAGPVIRVKHVGSYRLLARTHKKIAAWLAAQGIERNGDAWEAYISDPTSTVETELLTYVYYPVSYEKDEKDPDETRTPLR